MGIYARLQSDGKLLAYNHESGKFNADLEYKTPQSSQQKERAFTLFIFGEEVSEVQQENHCNEIMGKGDYQCLPDENGSCWFSISFQPDIGDTGLIAKAVEGGCHVQLPASAGGDAAQITPEDTSDLMCTDSTSDPKNCGECGKTCAAKESCCEGTCVDVQGGNAQHCGACGSACQGGLGCCGGQCVQLKKSTQHCGKCGQTCQGNELCCSGTCADIQGNNNNHCGACGRSCQPGFPCCSGECTDLQTEPKHCGKCGQTCSGEQKCIKGQCLGAGSCTSTAHCPKGSICRVNQCISCSGEKPNANCDGVLTFSGTGSIRVNGLGIHQQNILVGGYYDGTLSLDGKTYSSQGDSDAYIAKLTQQGKLVWLAEGKGRGRELCESIGVDAQGNVYYHGLYGRALQNATFGSKTITTRGHQYEVQASKIDASGKYIWTEAFANGNLQWSQYFTADAQGNSYVSGWVLGSRTGEATFGSITLKTGDTHTQTYAAKIDTNGKFLWAVLVGSRGENDKPGPIHYGTSGSTYFGTHWLGTALVGQYSFRSRGQEDFAVTKVDKNGSIVWSKHFGGTGRDLLTVIHGDHQGNLYIAGHFSGTMQFGPTLQLTSKGKFSSFIAKLDASGKVLWAKTMTSRDIVHTASLLVLPKKRSSSATEIYFVGSFTGSATFDNFTLTSAGDKDIFVIKLDQTGKIFWAEKAGGAGVDYPGRGIAIDPSGFLYIGGVFAKGQQTTFGHKQVNSTQQHNAFIWKLKVR